MAHQQRQLLHHKLQLHYGHRSFRSLQLEACEAILNGQDTLLILPSGGPNAHAITLYIYIYMCCSTLYIYSLVLSIPTRRLLGIILTGGKSLTYQLPVLLRDPGITVVISPVRMLCMHAALAACMAWRGR